MFDRFINPSFTNSHNAYVRMMDYTEFYFLFVTRETEAHKIKALCFSLIKYSQNSGDSNLNHPDSCLL